MYRYFEDLKEARFSEIVIGYLISNIIAVSVLMFMRSNLVQEPAKSLMTWGVLLGVTTILGSFALLKKEHIFAGVCLVVAAMTATGVITVQGIKLVNPTFLKGQPIDVQIAWCSLTMIGSAALATALEKLFPPMNRVNY